MSGTNTTPKKRSFGFDDIFSILDGKKTRPPARPALPASTEAEAQAAAAVQEPPRVIALPEDHNLVPKLLSDIDQKNAEIIRLNSDLAGVKSELREKDFKINHYVLEVTEKDLKIKELQTRLDGLRDEVARLKAIQPVFTAPAQAPVVAQPQQPPVAVEAAKPELPVGQSSKPQEAPVMVQAAQPAQPDALVAAPVEAAGARPIKEQFNLKEDVVEEDVATIFRRLVKARDEEPAEAAEGASDVPRRPRSAKMYDL